MKTKNILIIVALFIFSCNSVCFAYGGLLGNNLTWTLENNILTISGNGQMVSCKGKDGSPSGYNQPWYNDRGRIYNIVIEEGVTSIGDYAFCDLYGLESINISSTVEDIGTYSFTGASLPSVDFPVGVKNIGDNAFTACQSLVSVTLPQGLLNIGNYSFYACRSLTSIVLPSSLTEIGDYAFNYCGLTSVALPSGLINFSISSFQGNNLSSLTVDNANNNFTSEENVLFNKTMTKIIFYLPNKTENNYIVPSTITEIGDSAFGECNNLTSVTIPSGVTKIGNGAFLSCKNLSDINIPDGVESIGERAFSNCSSLSSIDIPTGVQIINDFTFSECRKLKSIVLPNDLTTIGISAFENCGLDSIKLPESLLSIQTNAFRQSPLRFINLSSI
jgi:hypothetical protein